MLYELVNFSDQISALNIFKYITFRTGGAILTAFLFVMMFGPAIIDLLRIKQGKGQPISDDNPPEELNKYTDGGFYGHPYLAGTRVPRYEYMNKSDLIQLAATSTNPELCFPAHWAGSGFTFLDPAVVHRTAGRGGGMPASMAGDMIACFHGSWSRTEPAGHCVARVIFDPVEKRPIGYVKLVDGLKPLGDHKWQPLIRPVDAVQALDGTSLTGVDDAVLRSWYATTNVTHLYGDISMLAIATLLTGACLGALRTGLLPRWICGLGLLAAAAGALGTAGVVLAVPPLAGIWFGGLFGWTLWLPCTAIGLIVRARRAPTRV